MKKDCRAAAATTLAAVMAGNSLQTALPQGMQRVSSRDRALLQELCYGCLRAWPRLDALAKQLLNKALRSKDDDIHALILLGLYQLEATRIPDHAAVAATVAATGSLGKGWARGMVNAVLRRFLRERQRLEEQLTPAAVAAHPQWLYQRLQTDWPGKAAAIMSANNGRPPMTLRVNRRQTDPAVYLQTLHDAGIEASPGQLAPSAIYLQRAVDVDELPGFADGLVSVQDEAAQLAAPLLRHTGDEQTLDACAAPGGKTCHLLESETPPGHLVAADIDATRLQRVQENLERLALGAELRHFDAAHPDASFEAGSFQRILVDAPCSASGVIRRHPDVLLLRRESDIDSFAAQQLAILKGLWPLLAPGGSLLYVTCSVLKAENSEVIARFLATQSDASEDALEVEWGEACTHGRQVLPEENGPDGLYFARLQRSS